MSDSVPVMTGLVEILDSDLLSLWESAAAAGFFGITPEGMRGRRFSKLGLTPEMIKRWVAACRESERLGNPVRFEYAKEIGGREYQISVTIRFVGIGENERSCCSYIIEDVTEQRQLEQQLRESHERFALLTRSDAEMAAGKTAQEIITGMIHAMEDVFRDIRVRYSDINASGQATDFPSDEQLGAGTITGRWPLLSESPHCWRMLQERQALIVEDVAVDGGVAGLSDFLLQQNCRALLAAPVIHSNRLVGMLRLEASQPRCWTQHEITTLTAVADALATVLKEAQAQQERRLTDRALRRANKRVGNILESITDAFFGLDREWRFTYINPQAEMLAGRSRAELLGKILWEEFPQQVKTKLFTEYRRAVAQQTPAHFEEQFEDGAWLQIHAYPSQDGLSVYIKNLTEERRAQQGLRESHAKLKRSLDGMVRAMSFAIEVRDPYTAIHQQRVGAIASAIAKLLGYSDEQVEEIRIAGLLHDIGKIAVPAEIMSRPGPLTAAEFSIIKMHTQIGYNILSGIEFAAPVALVALQHHERLDGSGYPQGLTGAEMLPESRIMAIADVVEAMASHRPYRPALGTERALEEVLHNRGVLYDASAVDACFELFREHGFDFEQLVAVETRGSMIPPDAEERNAGNV